MQAPAHRVSPASKLFTSFLKLNFYWVYDHFYTIGQWVQLLIFWKLVRIKVSKALERNMILKKRERSKSNICDALLFLLSALFWIYHGQFQLYFSTALKAEEWTKTNFFFIYLIQPNIWYFHTIIVYNVSMLSRTHGPWFTWRQYFVANLHAFSSNFFLALYLLFCYSCLSLKIVTKQVIILDLRINNTFCSIKFFTL